MIKKRTTCIIEFSKQLDAQLKHHIEAGLYLRTIAIEAPIKKGDITITYKNKKNTSLYQQVCRSDGSWSELYEHPDQI